MKKILIFIGLKIMEILGVCGITAIAYGIGCFSTRVLGFATHMDLWYEIVIMGFVCLFILFAGFLICMGIWQALKANWKWADKIVNK